MKIMLDAECMETEEQAHEYLRIMLGFPEYYGGNLDALYDCVSDCSGLVVGVSNNSRKSDHIKDICQVMRDAGAQVEEEEE